MIVVGQNNRGGRDGRKPACDCRRERNRIEHEKINAMAYSLRGEFAPMLCRVRRPAINPSENFVYL